ncbi:hypothetical protein HY605_00960 [Candidatus Peregrinibacteria bacterium]|nr:hypothetical protein [Candidatus Peregrinibacteria bacterium]
MVATRRGVGIRKEYFGVDAKPRFLDELRALERLRGIARVPEVLEIDPYKFSVTQSFIFGQDLERVLSAFGARLTGEDCRLRFAVTVTFQDIFAEYLREGAKYSGSLPRQLINDIYSQLQAVHRAGIMLYDLKYGNIIIENKSGKPYLVDFDGAQVFTSLSGRAFLVERDRDVARFNEMFGTSFPTYDILHSQIVKKNYPAAMAVYASSYIGHGLRIGDLWDRTSGFGRWEYILKKNLPVKPGDKVLSLGTNNSSVELSLLRGGAASVCALEQNADYIAQGEFLRAAFEWADNRRYNLKYINANMLKALDETGTFDSVMALCSLYYLSETDMLRLAQHLSVNTKSFILQCNVQQGIAREDADQYRRASLDFAVNLLRKVGFSELKVISPEGYSRPLVFGFRGNIPVGNSSGVH